MVISTFYAYRGVELTFWVLFPGTKQQLKIKNYQVLSFFLRLLGLGSLEFFCYAFIYFAKPPLPTCRSCNFWHS